MTFFQTYSSAVVQTLSFLTLVGDVLIFVVLGFVLIKPSSRGGTWLSRYGIPFMLLVALIATLGSLFFSEIAGWIPCKLCWFQRIFMYPQVVLLTVALWKKDQKIAPYLLALCLVGMSISAVHYLEQVQAALNPVAISAVCDLTGVSCADSQIEFKFGYVTIPMMALTAFMLNALFAVSLSRRKN